jgi:tripartite-type tricarboxylate transporter receptor subunit TctC
MRFTKTVMAALLVFAAAGTAAHADWPNDRPIRILVGAGPGGGTDIITRFLADRLSKVLKQSVFVENKQGAGGTLAATEVSRAAPDGYTAIMFSAGNTVSAAMFKSTPFDLVKSFAPVAMVTNSEFVFVARNDLPVNDIKGLIALAKSEPGKLNFASVGLGSTQHLAGEVLAQDAGIKVTHIPYRTTPALVAALMAGQIDYAVELVQAVGGQVAAGKLKLLAVASPQRWPALPDVPTAAESGAPGYSVVGWYGLAYPAGTPRPIVDKMYGALKQILDEPAIREQIAKIGAVVHVLDSDQFHDHIKLEIAKWSAARDKAGLKAQ